ncbi:MAG: DUF935 family protein [Rikenellaceae bacterium]
MSRNRNKNRSQKRPQNIPGGAFSGYNLARKEDRERLRKVLVDINLQTDALTRKDMRSWRSAHQVAVDVENPRRGRLYDIYSDVELDLHTTGCVDQRKGFTQSKSYKLVDSKGVEDEEATQLFEAQWFRELVDHILDSRFWGHSLIQLGDVIKDDAGIRYKDVTLIPRKHVLPEYGVIIRDRHDNWTQGVSYRDASIADWVIEAGRPKDLGLYLKVAAQTIPKKNMLAYWDQFGEIFGMPIRVARTTSRDASTRQNIEKMLDSMGAAAWGLFPEGTEIDIKESSRTDTYNVYDKRIDRANSEMSKGILNQTMTIDSGSSLSQSEVHLEVLENVIKKDGTMVQTIINDQLIPRMIKHGFPIIGLRFVYNESIDYTPEQQTANERMLLEHFECDPKFFENKYGVTILSKKTTTQPQTLSRPFFD